MSPVAQKLLEEARKLPRSERDWLIDNLLVEEASTSEEEYAAWRESAGEPEPGYEEWFRAGVEEALADTSGDVPHEEMMKQFREAIARARKLKKTA